VNGAVVGWNLPDTQYGPWLLRGEEGNIKKVMARKTESRSKLLDAELE